MGVGWERISLGRGSRLDFVGELGLVRMGTGGIKRTGGIRSEERNRWNLEALLGQCGNLVLQNLPEIYEGNPSEDS